WSSLMGPGLLALTIAAAGCLTEQKRADERAQRRRVQRARRLNDASASLAASLELNEILGAVPRVVQQLFGPRATAVAVALTGDSPGLADTSEDALEAELRWLCETRLRKSDLATKGWQVQRCVRG